MTEEKTEISNPSFNLSSSQNPQSIISNNSSDLLSSDFFSSFNPSKKLPDKKKKIHELTTNLKNNPSYLTQIENQKKISNLYEVILTNLIENNNNFVLSQIDLIDTLGKHLSQTKDYKKFYAQALPKLFDKFYLQNQKINQGLTSMFNNSIQNKTLELKDYYPYVENISAEEDDDYKINVLNFLGKQINKDKYVTINKVPKNIVDTLTKLAHDDNSEISEISFKLVETLNNRDIPSKSNNNNNDNINNNIENINNLDKNIKVNVNNNENNNIYDRISDNNNNKKDIINNNIENSNEKNIFNEIKVNCNNNNTNLEENINNNIKGENQENINTERLTPKESNLAFSSFLKKISDVVKRGSAVNPYNNTNTLPNDDINNINLDTIDLDKKFSYDIENNNLYNDLLNDEMLVEDKSETNIPIPIKHEFKKNEENINNNNNISQNNENENGIENDNNKSNNDLAQKNDDNYNDNENNSNENDNNSNSNENGIDQNDSDEQLSNNNNGYEQNFDDNENDNDNDKDQDNDNYENENDYRNNNSNNLQQKEEDNLSGNINLDLYKSVPLINNRNIENDLNLEDEERPQIEPQPERIKVGLMNNFPLIQQKEENTENEKDNQLPIKNEEANGKLEPNEEQNLNLNYNENQNEEHMNIDEVQQNLQTENIINNNNQKEKINNNINQEITENNNINSINSNNNNKKEIPQIIVSLNSINTNQNDNNSNENNNLKLNNNNSEEQQNPPESKEQIYEKEKQEKDTNNEKEKEREKENEVDQKQNEKEFSEVEKELQNKKSKMGFRGRINRSRKLGSIKSTRKNQVQNEQNNNSNKNEEDNQSKTQREQSKNEKDKEIIKESDKKEEIENPQKLQNEPKEIKIKNENKINNEIINDNNNNNNNICNNINGNKSNGMINRNYNNNSINNNMENFVVTKENKNLNQNFNNFSMPQSIDNDFENFVVTKENKNAFKKEEEDNMENFVVTKENKNLNQNINNFKVQQKKINEPFNKNNFNNFNNINQNNQIENDIEEDDGLENFVVTKKNKNSFGMKPNNNFNFKKPNNININSNNNFDEKIVGKQETNHNINNNNNNFKNYQDFRIKVNEISNKNINNDNINNNFNEIKSSYNYISVGNDEEVIPVQNHPKNFEQQLELALGQQEYNDPNEKEILNCLSENDNNKPQNSKSKEQKDDPRFDTIKSLLGKEIIDSLSSPKWEVKKHGYELINSYLSENNFDSYTAGDLFDYIKIKLKNFKETNFNINREAINVFTTMCQKKLTSKDNLVSLIVGYYEKLADSKLKDNTLELINSSIDIVGPSLILQQLIKNLLKKNNSKVLTEYASLFSKVIDDYDFKEIPNKELIDYCIFMANNNNPQVRTSATNLLCSLYKYLGPDIRNKIKDIKESTLKIIEAELEKVEVISVNNAPINKKKKMTESNIELNSKNFKNKYLEGDLGEEGLGNSSNPVDISKKITPQIIKNISDGKWVEKKEAFDTIDKILLDANMKILPDGLVDLFNLLKTKLSDGNKNLVKTSISLLAKLIQALGHEFKPWTKQTALSLIPNLADKSQVIRNECKLCFEKWVKYTGLETLVIYFPQFLGNENTEMRINVMKFIKKYHKKMIKNKNIAENVYKECVDSLLICLQDRSNNVRTKAEEIIKLSLNYVPIDNYLKKSKDFKPAIANDLKQILEKIEENLGVEDEDDEGGDEVGELQIKRKMSGGSSNSAEQRNLSSTYQGKRRSTINKKSCNIKLSNVDNKKDNKKENNNNNNNNDNSVNNKNDDNDKNNNGNNNNKEESENNGNNNKKNKINVKTINNNNSKKGKNKNNNKSDKADNENKLKNQDTDNISGDEVEENIEKNKSKKSNIPKNKSKNKILKKNTINNKPSKKSETTNFSDEEDGETQNQNQNQYKTNSPLIPTKKNPHSNSQANKSKNKVLKKASNSIKEKEKDSTKEEKEEKSKDAKDRRISKFSPDKPHKNMPKTDEKKKNLKKFQDKDDDIKKNLKILSLEEEEEEEPQPNNPVEKTNNNNNNNNSNNHSHLASNSAVLRNRKKKIQIHPIQKKNNNNNTNNTNSNNNKKPSITRPSNVFLSTSRITQSKIKRYELDKKYKFDLNSITKDDLVNIKDLSENLFTEEFNRKIFNEDFKRQIEALKDMKNNLDKKENIPLYLDNIDIILKLIGIKFQNNLNPQVLKNLYEFFDSLYYVIKNFDYKLSVIESGIIFSLLIDKFSLNNTKLKNQLIILLHKFVNILDVNKIMIMILNLALNSKNKIKSNVLDMVIKLCSENKLNITTKNFIKIFCRYLETNDNLVKMKIFNIFKGIYISIKDELWGYLELGDKELEFLQNNLLKDDYNDDDEDEEEENENDENEEDEEENNEEDEEENEENDGEGYNNNNNGDYNNYNGDNENGGNYMLSSEECANEVDEGENYNNYNNFKNNNNENESDGGDNDFFDSNGNDNDSDSLGGENFFGKDNNDNGNSHGYNNNNNGSNEKYYDLYQKNKKSINNNYYDYDDYSNNNRNKRYFQDNNNVNEPNILNTKSNVNASEQIYNKMLNSASFPTKVPNYNKISASNKCINNNNNNTTNNNINNINTNASTNIAVNTLKNKEVKSDKRIIVQQRKPQKTVTEKGIKEIKKLKVQKNPRANKLSSNLNNNSNNHHNLSVINKDQNNINLNIIEDSNNPNNNNNLTTTMIKTPGDTNNKNNQKKMLSSSSSTTGGITSEKDLLDIMSNLLSDNESEKLNTIIIIHEILCSKYQENKFILIPYIDNIILIFIKITHKLFDVENIKNIPVKFAKYLVTILCKLASNKELIMHLSYKVLLDLSYELLSYLLINDLDKIGDNQEGNIIFKSLNSAMLRVLENTDTTSVILALLEIIRQSQNNENEHTLSNLAIKCLIKATQDLKNILPNIQLDKILLQMHLLLINYDKYENMERKSQADIMIIRFIKNFVIDVTKYKKEKVFEDYSKSIRNHCYKDKHIFIWIKNTIENSNRNDSDMNLNFNINNMNNLNMNNIKRDSETNNHNNLDNNRNNNNQSNSSNEYSENNNNNENNGNNNNQNGEEDNNERNNNNNNNNNEDNGNNNYNKDNLNLPKKKNLKVKKAIVIKKVGGGTGTGVGGVSSNNITSNKINVNNNNIGVKSFNNIIKSGNRINKSNNIANNLNNTNRSGFPKNGTKISVPNHLNQLKTKSIELKRKKK